MSKLSRYRHWSVSCLVLFTVVAAAGWLAADERVSIETQSDAHAGSYVVVPVTASSDFGIDSVGFRLGYPAEWLTPAGVYTTASTRDFDLRFDVEAPGQLLVELSGRVPVFGSGAVAWILFANDGAAGDRAALELFDAVLNGSSDATLDHGWLELALGQTTLSLPPDLVGSPGEMATAQLVADPADGILAMDVIIEFDSTVLQFVSAQPTSFASGFTVTPNLIEPGRLYLSIFGVNPASGTGPMVNVNFMVGGQPGESTPLDLVIASVNEGTIPSTLVDGFFVVCDNSDSDDDGVSLCDGDCDDDDPDSFPGNLEVVCDGRDNDCDPETLDVLDGDGDQFACDVDCDDGNSAINPDATEVCDGEDNDCDSVIDNVLVPSEVVALEAGENSPSTFSWSAVASATGYDVVRGSLSDLIETAGDFSLATEACLADDAAPTSLDDPDEPPSSSGFWYIVRPVNCGGSGTYDSGGIAQAGERDLETDLSPMSCP